MLNGLFCCRQAAIKADQAPGKLEGVKYKVGHVSLCMLMHFDFCTIKDRRPMHCCVPKHSSFDDPLAQVVYGACATWSVGIWAVDHEQIS